LLAGDALRTGPAGTLALRFADETMIRVHRNSELTVKALPEDGTAELQLDTDGLGARHHRRHRRRYRDAGGDRRHPRHRLDAGSAA
jgi:hypothetical protein